MDTITIPAKYQGEPDAELSVAMDDAGDGFTMTLTHADGHVIAAASGFRPGAGMDFGAERAAMTASTFGAFLTNALEDPEARESWEVIADDASEWTDALALMELDEGWGNNEPEDSCTD